MLLKWMRSLPPHGCLKRGALKRQVTPQPPLSGHRPAGSRSAPAAHPLTRQRAALQCAGGRLGSPSLKRRATGTVVVRSQVMSGVCICLLLFLNFILVSIMSNAVVGSLYGMSTALHLNAAFVAVTVLPFIGNIAELATATMAALHDNLDLSIAVALGSATQISMFILPLGVLFGWAIGVPFSLNFASPQLVIAFSGAVIAVAFILSNGEGNWLKGVMLISIYVLINIGFLASVEPNLGAAKGAALVGHPPPPSTIGVQHLAPPATTFVATSTLHHPPPVAQKLTTPA